LPVPKSLAALLTVPLVAGCASLSGGPREIGDAPRQITSDAAVEKGTTSATLHFGEGRQALSFRLHERSGVILLYRISARRGMKVRSSARLPGITVPLRIATAPIGPSSSCTEVEARVSCTVGEEWCPMPNGVWWFHVEKLAGPSGDVTVSFLVGKPPRSSAT
jgi:hypothetical protein